MFICKNCQAFMITEGNENECLVCGHRAEDDQVDTERSSNFSSLFSTDDYKSSMVIEYDDGKLIKSLIFIEDIIDAIFKYFLVFGEFSSRVLLINTAEKDVKMYKVSDGDTSLEIFVGDRVYDLAIVALFKKLSDSDEGSLFLRIVPNASRIIIPSIAVTLTYDKDDVIETWAVDQKVEHSNIFTEGSDYWSV